MKKFALMGMIFVIVALGLAACTSNDGGLKDVRLALDWFPNANHAGLFLALENGYFEEEGLKVTAYTPVDPASILQTVGTGADEFGINYQPDLLLARAQGVPVVSVAGIVQRPLNSVLTLKSSGITRPRDLVGKKVGYPGIPTDEPLLDTMLKYDGARGLEDVELVNVGFNLAAALMDGQVDACVGCYWTHESIAIENEGYPVNIMRMEEWGVPSYYELVLVTSEDQLDKDPETVQAFTRAFLRGYHEAAQDPQGAIDALVKAHPETDQAIDRPGVDLIAPLWGMDVPAVGWQERDRWVDFTRWMKDNGALDQSVDPLKSFTNRFVEELP